MSKPTIKEMASVVVGIDPGQSGGIAIINSAGLILPYKMPETERDIYDLLESYKISNPIVWLEKVHAMPKQGVSSTWKFAANYGFLRGIVTALKYPLYDVTPQTWQKAMGCMSRGDKNITKAKAQQLYPQIKITHKIADCLLIATYGVLYGKYI